VLVRRHINPQLGHLRLDRLRAEHIERWLEGLTRAGVGLRTRQSALIRLRTALTVAVQRRHLGVNPAEHVEPRRALGEPGGQRLASRTPGASWPSSRTSPFFGRVYSVVARCWTAPRRDAGTQVTTWISARGICWFNAASTGSGARAHWCAKARSPTRATGRLATAHIDRAFGTGTRRFEADLVLPDG
jgi:hypothetical protein